MNNTWEHPFKNGDKTEPVQSFEAFQVWLEMGEKRSLKAVAERLEKSHDTIKKYSCTWKWSERLQDKLSYENQQIHAKQLEGILTSLDIDQNRDLFIQHILNGLAGDMLELTMNSMNHFTHINPETRMRETNSALELLERLTNMYCKLEKVHSDHQQKYIQLNKNCLHVKTFEDQDEFMKTLKHGKRESMDIQAEVIDGASEYMKKGFNMFGREIGLVRTATPLEHYGDGSGEQLTESEQQMVDEVEIEKLED